MKMLYFQKCTFLIVLSFTRLTEPVKTFSTCNDFMERSNFWLELLEGYNRARPPARSLNATVELMLHIVTELDQLKGKAQINLNFVEKWSDPRLAYSCDDSQQNASMPDGFMFGEAEAEQIWQPKLAIVNAMTKYALEPIKFRRSLKVCTFVGLNNR